ncbi:glycosyltransferase family 9 protein [Cupriavidus gilardii]|uniref:glycosyltransferase family 9 protein n=1 Tax=Cupriavidus gilardii TaxID=82541 RepID=UPI001573139F|nr:glycosyltransferase family 9 protein [Cupriavidus gilardii]NSX02863.1 glycosyltransferase family 9 protein [Cupriavidus gilardii]
MTAGAVGEPARAIVPDVRRIAVLRANAVGDYVLTLPALEALKAAYPQATLTLLGKRWHAEFLDGRPGPVDEVVCLPAVPGVTAPPDTAEPAAEEGDALRDFFTQMQRRRFDLAVQLHGGGQYSNPLVSALGARVTAGFRAPGASALDRNFPYLPPDIDLHPRALLLNECVGLVGARASAIEPRLSLRARDHDELAPAQAAVADLTRPLVVLQPGATDARRRWHADGFAAVGDALAAQGALVAINGDPSEAQLVHRVAAAMRHRPLALPGTLSLGALAALLARACLVVSNDTGPAHLARALDVPTVTLYWIGNLPSYGPLSARWHRVAVSYRVHCPVCGARAIDGHCGHTASFLDELGADAVIGLALQAYRASIEGRDRRGAAATSA